MPVPAVPPADPPEWRSVDPLGEALHLLHMSGVFYARCELGAPWGLALPPMPGTLLFHVVSSGRCLLEVTGEPARWLSAGDLVVLPRADGHVLRSDAGAELRPLFDLPRELMGERYEVMRVAGAGEPALLVCGALRFDQPAARQLLRALPRVLTLSAPPMQAAPGGPDGDWLRTLVHWMGEEALHVRPGGDAVLTRLADIVVIQAIRHWLAHAPAARQGWLGALQDPRIGRAISAVHRAPERDWTIASLAGEAAMSRSAFAAHFSRLMHMSVMDYVTQWRMHLAMDWLRTRHGQSLAELATRAGYASEAAFSRAFKRFHGVAPGAVARAQPGYA